MIIRVLAILAGAFVARLAFVLAKATRLMYRIAEIQGEMLEREDEANLWGMSQAESDYWYGLDNPE